MIHLTMAENFFMAVIENKHPLNDSDHMFMFGNISSSLNNDITGVFLGHQGYGNFIAIWDMEMKEEMRVEFKLEFQSSSLWMHYSLFDSKHLLKPYSKINLSTELHYKESSNYANNVNKNFYIGESGSKDIADHLKFLTQSRRLYGANIYLNPPEMCVTPVMLGTKKYGRLNSTKCAVVQLKLMMKDKNYPIRIRDNHIFWIFRDGRIMRVKSHLDIDTTKNKLTNQIGNLV